MMRLISFFFTPPPMPPIELPFMPARMEASVRLGLKQVGELIYYRGVWDGFIFGVLITILLLPSARSGLAKGVKYVAELV